VERLEARTLLASGDPIISEFVASNSDGLADQDGDHSDWIEVYNPTASPIDLGGWFLTDDPDVADRWRFPSVTLEPSGFLVVFASDKNRATAGAELHTNFKLGASGDYLALNRPDGTVAQAFSPAYPRQSNDVSYGVTFDASTLLAAGARAEVRVPSDGTLEGIWNTPEFSPDGSWLRGPTGVGYGLLQPGFSVRYVKANVEVGSLDVADQVLSDPLLQTQSVRTSADTINYVNTGSGANFSGDQPFPTQSNDVDFDDFVLEATGLVTIPTAGAWSFGVNSDDGFRLTLERNGQTFVSEFASPRGPGDTIQVFTIPEPGRWNIRLEYFERGGGAEVELFAAPGSRPAFDGGVFRLVGDSANGGLAVGSVLEDDPGDISLVGRFVADDLNALLDGARVDAWTDRDPDGGGSIAAGAGGTPRLAKGVLNGHSVVRFDPVDGVDQLRISADSNPLGGVGDFSAAVVFRAGSPGIGGAGDWWANAGLVDAEQGGSTEDWGMSFSAEGRVAAGIGNPDVSVYSRGGLDDGRAHVAVLVRSAGVLSIYVDGRLQQQRADASTLPRNVADLVFGSLQTNQNGFSGDIAEVRLYDNDLTASQVQRMAAELDAVYGLPGVVRSAVGTDVRDLMQGANSTVYVRIPFESPDPTLFDGLSLRMRYDDGFVAYLNGVAVASANAPTSPAYNASATAARDGDPTAVVTFSLTPYLGLLHAGTNLLAIRGLNASASDPDLLVLPELIATRLHADEFRYFATPTPGAPNSSPYLGLIEPVKATVSRGFFDSPFAVALSVPTPGAQILYTLDGSEPTATHGLVYGGPFVVSGTTTLRAGAFAPGYLSSPTIAETYLFLGDVVQQSLDGSAPAGWPTNWGGNVVDYGMDPDIVDSPLYGPALLAALKAIPTISLTTDLANLFDPSIGIYANAYQQGEAWERPASVELINPDGSKGFQVNAGLRIRGGYSRSGDNPKHAFRLFFRGEYGASNLDFPLFGTEGTDSFQKVDLRTAQNYSWSFGGDPNNNFVAELFSRETMRDMGQPYARSRFYQLYIDGQYWGLYQTEERPEANYAASYFGGDKDDYDVIKVETGPYTTQATDGNFDAWNRLWQGVTDPAVNLASDAAYYKLQGKNPDGSDNPNYEVLVDVGNLIDYMIVILYGGNLDAPISAFLGNQYPNNFFAIRDRTGRTGFRFIIHDAEHTLLDLNENRNGPYPAGEDFPRFNPQFLHQQLMANVNYRQAFADHVQKAFFNGGPLSPEAAIARFRSEAGQIALAIIGESARWGDAKRPDSPLTQADWQAAVDRVIYDYLPYRTAIVLDQFRANGLYPALAAPVFRVNNAASHGGAVSPGDRLTLTAPAGLVYYTTDGSDPRLPNGAINPSALAYDPSVTTSSLIAPGSAWSFLDTGADPGAGWTGAGYDDGSWATGTAELGYGDGDEATVIGYGPDQDDRFITTYFRRSFVVSDPGIASDLTLRLKRDDGAVVYINGVEVARSNMPAGPIGPSTLAASAVVDADESAFSTISLDPSVLVAGVNVIAVEIHQAAPNSSDISFDLGLELSASTAPPITLSRTSLVTARAYLGGAWSAVDAALFSINVPAAAGNLAITEIHYNPLAADLSRGELDVDRQQFEFLELRNIGTQEIDLRGVKFTSGIAFDFTGAAITALSPGAYLLIVKNPAAFASRYGQGLPVAGTYGGAAGGLASLSNSGERLLLVDASGGTIEDFAYGTRAPWPRTPDGDGPSLVRIDPMASAGDPLNWRASGVDGGSPGSPDTSPPTITPIADLTIAEDTSSSELAFTVGDSETPASELVIAVSSNNAVLLPAGSLALAGAGTARTLRITPAPDAFGNATITLSVADSDGSITRTTFLLTVAPVDDPPVAAAEAYATDEDRVLAVSAAQGVLVNDVDIEGDRLTARLDRGPAHGTITLKPDGSFVYTPAPDYHGTDSFIYYAHDGTLGGQPVTVDIVINPVADPPALDPIPDAVVDELSALSFLAIATDPDLPDDALTFTLDPGAPAGAAIDPETGRFSWTPSESQGPGTYSIIVRVADAGPSPSTATRTFLVTVNEVNAPPRLPELSDIEADELLPIEFAVVGQDPDDPTQSLAYSLDPGAPAGARIDPATGVFSWTPSEAQGPGSFLITVRATDDGSPGRSATTTFRVTVREVNSAPALPEIGDRVVDEQSTLSFAIVATDPDIPRSGLTYSLDPGAPAGARIDPITGAFFWSPSEAQGPGTFAITVRATDDGSPGLSAAATFQVTVREVNRPLSLGLLPDLAVDEEVPLTFTAVATDPDIPAGSLRFALAPGAPAGAAIDPETGRFSWTPSESQGPGTYSITVRVGDGGTPELTSTRTFSVHVREANRVPVISPIPDASIRLGETLEVVASATDPDVPLKIVVYTLDRGAPAGASVDPITGVIRWTPSASQGPGRFAITVRAIDIGQPRLSASATFSVDVTAPPPPSIDVGLAASAVAGQPFTRAGGFISPGRGPWTASIDYGDGTGLQPLTVTPANTFLLRHSYAATGSYVAIVRVRDGYGTEGQASLAVDVAPAPVALAQGPILAVRRRGTTVSLIFSGAVNPADASEPSNYQLSWAGRDRVLGTSDDKPLRPANVAYDAARHAVVIGIKGRLPSAARALRLWISGSAIRDSLGRPLDGDGDGMPGGDISGIAVRMPIGVRTPSARRVTSRGAPSRP
jgi:hypothetical protein